MTLRAVEFLIGDPSQIGHLVGVALVCAEARYCSTYFLWKERKGRRFAMAGDWGAIESELAALPAGPLEDGSILRRLIVGSARSLAVTLGRYTDVETPGPLHAATALDARLLVMAGIGSETNEGPQENPTPFPK